MTSISATIAGASCFSQGSDLPAPHQSVEELMNWLSSELHLFLSTNNARTVVPTPGSNSQGPEPANEHQGHPEGITTFSTAVIPFSGRAVPTIVTLSLVPLHFGTGQYPPSLDQGDQLSPFPPSHLSELSRPSMNDPMAAGDITIVPRYLDCVPLGSFPITHKNTITQLEVCYDYQPSGHGGTTQELEPILNGNPAAVTASPGAKVYPPPFNQVPGAYSDHLVSGHPSSSSLVNRGIVLPAHQAHQNEGNGQSTSRRLLGQTYQDTPTLSAASRTAGPMYQHPSRYQCTMCDASYARLSGLNRHYKDKHTAWRACALCDLRFSSGRKYLLARHLATDHPHAK